VVQLPKGKVTSNATPSAKVLRDTTTVSTVGIASNAVLIASASAPTVNVLLVSPPNTT